MYTPKFFNDKRVILENGQRAILSDARLNEFDDIIACTNLTHPEEKNAFLWINVNLEVKYILKFDYYSYQYRNKKTNETVMLPFDVDDIVKANYDLIGNFDIY